MLTVDIFRADSCASISLIHQRKKELYLTEPILTDSMSISYDDKKECTFECDCIILDSQGKKWIERFIASDRIILKHRNIQVMLNKNEGVILHNVDIEITNIPNQGINGVFIKHIIVSNICNDCDGEEK